MTFSFNGVFSERRVRLVEPCSFCWFILDLYPDLRGISESDVLTFRKHLEQKHAWAPDSALRA
jgi:hypothetical protein